jgi:hypothetical protein
MQFHFHLTGAQTELNVAIERKGIAREMLWKAFASNQSSTWKKGRVWLGIVSQFKVFLLSFFQRRGFQCGKLVLSVFCVRIRNLLAMCLYGLCLSLCRFASLEN